MLFGLLEIKHSSQKIFLKKIVCIWVHMYLWEHAGAPDNLQEDYPVTGSEDWALVTRQQSCQPQRSHPWNFPSCVRNTVLFWWLEFKLMLKISQWSHENASKGLHWRCEAALQTGGPFSEQVKGRSNSLLCLHPHSHTYSLSKGVYFVGIELKVLLPQSPRCWDYRHMLSGLSGIWW